MCDVKRCCFCIPLKVGAYLASAYTILFGALGLVGMIWVLVERFSFIPYTPQTEDYMSADAAADVKEATRSHERTVFIATACTYALWLLFGILLAIGTANKVRGMLMPWVVMTSVFVTVECLAFVASVYFYARVADGGPNHYLLINIGFIVGAIFLNVTSIVGVTAHFRELGRQKSTLSIYGDSMPAPYGQYKYHIQA